MTSPNQEVRVLGLPVDPNMLTQTDEDAHVADVLQPGGQFDALMEKAHRLLHPTCQGEVNDWINTPSASCAADANTGDPVFICGQCDFHITLFSRQLRTNWLIGSDWPNSVMRRNTATKL